LTAQTDRIRRRFILRKVLPKSFVRTQQSAAIAAPSVPSFSDANVSSVFMEECPS